MNAVEALLAEVERIINDDLAPADIVDEIYTRQPDEQHGQHERAEPELVVSTLRGDANVFFFRAWQKRDKRLRDLPVLSLALDENILTLLDGTDLSQNYLAGSYFQAVERPEKGRHFVVFAEQVFECREIDLTVFRGLGHMLQQFLALVLGQVSEDVLADRKSVV